MMGALKSSASLAQDFQYAPLENNLFASDVNYIIGKEGDNVIVWLYKFNSRTLQVNLYTSDMKPVSKKTLVLHSLDWFNHFSFLKKASGYDIVLQYISKGKAITQRYSFNKNKNSIVPGQTLDESDVYAQLIIKQSADYKYTGFLKGFRTTDDSLLVQYSLYNVLDSSVYQTSIVLPYKYRLINLEDALVDNSGNLFFYTLTSNHTRDTQTVELYEVNVKKDSLFTNQISRQGFFQGLHTKQSDIAGYPCLSGVLTETSQTVSSATKANRYFFLQQLSADLIQQKNMILVPFPYGLDSSQLTLYNFEVTNFVESKDSSYLFYIGGMLNSTYQNIVRKEAMSSIQYPTIYPEYQVVDVPLGPSFIIGAVGSAIEPNPASTGNISVISKALSGDNFFLTATVTRDKQLSAQIYKDTLHDNTYPGFETVLNTGKNIQYLYSRSLKNKKQVMYDVVISNDGSVHMYPLLLPQPSFQIAVGSGVQVSPGSIVFPYLNNNKLSFVKLNLK